MLYHLTEYGALLRSVVMFFLFEKWEVFRTYLNFIWGLFFSFKRKIWQCICECLWACMCACVWEFVQGKQEMGYVRSCTERLKRAHLSLSLSHTHTFSHIYSHLTHTFASKYTLWEPLFTLRAVFQVLSVHSWTQISKSAQPPQLPVWHFTARYLECGKLLWAK